MATTVGDLIQYFPWVSTVMKDDKGDLVLICREEGATFSALCDLRDLLGTSNINLAPRVDDDGYCDTCSSPYGVIVVTVVGAAGAVVDAPSWRDF